MSDERLNGLELGDHIETIFKVEPPLTPSKTEFGYIGVILRDTIEDKIQCHLCGKWFNTLVQHLNKTHKIKCDQYKKEFSLPPNFPLVNREISRKASENASKPENLKRLEEIREHQKTNSKSKKRQRQYYDFSGIAAKHTRLKGLQRDKVKELILNHLQSGKPCSVNEIFAGFPELKKQDISNLLQELKRTGKIETTKGKKWRLASKSN